MSFLSSLYSLSLCAVNLPHFQSLQSGGPAAPGSHGPTDPRWGHSRAPQLLLRGLHGRDSPTAPAQVLGVSHALHKTLGRVTIPDREMGDHVTALVGTQLAEVQGCLRHPPVAQAELRRALAKSWGSALPRVLHTGNGSFRHGGVSPTPGCCYSELEDFLISFNET